MKNWAGGWTIAGSENNSGGGRKVPGLTPHALRQQRNPLRVFGLLEGVGGNPIGLIRPPSRGLRVVMGTTRMGYNAGANVCLGMAGAPTPAPTGPRPGNRAPPRT